MQKAQHKLRTLTTAVLLAIPIATANDAPEGSYYVDVPPHHWAAPAVNALSRDGILLGNPDGSFGGTTLLSRYELAMILNRFYTHQQQQQAFGPAHEMAETIANLEAQVQRLTSQNTDLTNILQQLMATQNIEVSALNSRINELEEITYVLQTLSTTVAVGPAGPPGPPGPPGPIAYVHPNGEITYAPSPTTPVTVNAEPVATTDVVAEVAVNTEEQIPDAPAESYANHVASANPATAVPMPAYEDETEEPEAPEQDAPILMLDTNEYTIF